MARYESRSTAWWLFALAVLLGVGGLALAVGFGLAGRAEVFIGLGLVPFALVLANFGVLTVRVGGDELAWRFGPGPVGRRIPLRRVRSVEERRTPWYWGWGIRWTPRGWLWRAHGLDAVWLELDDGKWVGVGTQDPGGLSGALRARITE
jgi:hypothetical protein